MKKKKFSWMVLFIFALLLANCKKENQPFTICGTQCSASTPWTVETLNQGLPCFASKDACEQWALSNGYSDKSCIMCNQ